MQVFDRPIRPRSGRRGGVVALAMGVGLALVASVATPALAQTKPTEAQQLAALIKAAKKEGQVEFYTSATDTVSKPTMLAFQKKYGIKTRYLRLSAGELATRYAAEASSKVNRADVLLNPDSFFLHDGVGRKWVVPLNK